MERLPGYRSEALRSIRLGLVGAGAGSFIALAAVKKEVGSVSIWDDDIVDLTSRASSTAATRSSRTRRCPSRRPSGAKRWATASFSPSPSRSRKPGIAETR
jgi:hypothetical protein